jgi:hypothetical protein
VGYIAGQANTTGQDNTFIGRLTGNANTTASNNTFVGNAAGKTTTTGGNNSAFGGDGPLFSNTTGTFNVAIGGAALYSNTTASGSTAVGYQAGYGNTTQVITAFGYRAGYTQSGGSPGANTWIGYESGFSTTTGGANSALGYQSLRASTTATYNTAVGYQSAYSNTTGGYNTIVGTEAGYTATVSNDNAYFGWRAGYLSTGSSNTFIGDSAGGSMTTGQSNTIVGRYNGNISGLDMRTLSNYLVLADGDGNRVLTSGSGLTLALGSTAVPNSGTGITFPATQVASADANTLDDYEEGSWTPVVGGNATYISQAGTYVKIGRFVYVDFLLRINAIGTGSSTIMTGLPFVAGSGNSPRSSGSIAYAAALASNVYSLSINADGNGIQFEAFTGLSNGTVDNIAVWQNSAYIIGSATYYTSA